MNAATNERPKATSVIAKLKELGTEDPDIIKLANVLYEGPVGAAALKLLRGFQWVTISAKLHGSLGFSDENLRELYLIFIDEGLSDRFLAALDAAIRSADVQREAGKKVSVSYVDLRKTFLIVLEAVESEYPESERSKIKLDDGAIAELELDFFAGDGNKVTLRQILKQKIAALKKSHSSSAGAGPR